MWLDEQGREPNVQPGLLDVLGEHYDRELAGSELFGYVAGICAHQAYTAAFASDLAAPGIRVPLTADRHLFRTVSGSASG